MSTWGSEGNMVVLGIRDEAIEKEPTLSSRPLNC